MQMMFKDLKPKGLQRNEIEVPKTLKKIKQSKKPKINIGLIEEAVYYLKLFLDYAIEKTAQNITPKWFWYAMIIIIAIYLFIAII